MSVTLLIVGLTGLGIGLVVLGRLVRSAARAWAHLRLGPPTGVTSIAPLPRTFDWTAFERELGAYGERPERGAEDQAARAPPQSTASTTSVASSPTGGGRRKGARVCRGPGPVGGARLLDQQRGRCRLRGPGAFDGLALAVEA